jgi:hypothetical protein
MLWSRFEMYNKRCFWIWIWIWIWILLGSNLKYSVVCMVCMLNDARAL